MATDFYLLEAGGAGYLLEDGLTLLQSEAAADPFLGSVGAVAGNAVAAYDVISAIDVPVGGLVCVGFVLNANTAPTGVTDSKGNTYTPDLDTGSSGVPVSRGYIYHSILGSALSIGDTITVTMSLNVSRIAIAIEAFTPTGGLDGSSSAVNASSAAPSTGAASYSASGIAWGIIGNSDTQDPTITSGHTPDGVAVTSVGSNERHIRSFHAAVTGSGTSTGTGTFGVATAWVAGIVTFATL